MLRAGDHERRYVVLATWRNPLGDIVGLQLQKVYDGGLPGVPFVMFRQWWTGDEPSALVSSLPDARTPREAAAGLCDYYRGLATYYGIRALQCAYSVCWPLSTWYGTWAEYYTRLAEASCGGDEPATP